MCTGVDGSLKGGGSERVYRGRRDSVAIKGQDKEGGSGAWEPVQRTGWRAFRQ